MLLIRGELLARDSDLCAFTFTTKILHLLLDGFDFSTKTDLNSIGADRLILALDNV